MLKAGRSLNTPLQRGHSVTSDFSCAEKSRRALKIRSPNFSLGTIHRYRLDPLFTITDNSIRGIYGSEYIFKGLRHNLDEIKSTEGIDRAWVEEAEKVSEESWDTLTPTIRKPGSQIWVDFNPKDERSATYQKFVAHPSPDAQW